MAVGFFGKLRSHFFKSKKKNPEPVTLLIAPSAKEAGKPRFVELDALRGLAACVVVLGHYRSVPKIGPVWLDDTLLYSPCFIAVCAGPAVVLFFLLSGFVLSLPYNRVTPPSYRSFIVKRFFRIYVPYVVALGFAVLGASYFHDIKGNYSGWFLGQWSRPVDPWLVIQHLLFLGQYNTMAFNSPIWSLVEEMRISILFPLFCPLILRLPVVAAIALVPFLSIMEHFFHMFHFMMMCPRLLHHMGMFVLGIVLAKHRKEIRQWINSQSAFRYAGLIILTFVLLRLTVTFFFINDILEDWIAEMAAACLIVLSVGENHVSRFLRRAIPQFLGHISYSIYLIHIPILLFLIHVFHGSISLTWLFAPFILFTLLLSSIFYRLVELPSMQTGRGIARRLG